MQEKIQSWREEEGIPVTSEVGESSTTIPIPSLTLEPVHHTIPVVVARLADHERRIDYLEYDQDEAQSGKVELLQAQVSEVERRIGNMDFSVYCADDDINILREEVTELRRRVEHSERRAELAEERAFRAEQRMFELEQSLGRVSALLSHFRG